MNETQNIFFKTGEQWMEGIRENIKNQVMISRYRRNTKHIASYREAVNETPWSPTGACRLLVCTGANHGVCLPSPAPHRCAAIILCLICHLLRAPPQQQQGHVSRLTELPPSPRTVLLHHHVTLAAVRGELLTGLTDCAGPHLPHAAPSPCWSINQLLGSV